MTKKLSKNNISKILFITSIACFGVWDANYLQSCGSGGNKNTTLYNTVTGMSLSELYPSSVNRVLNDPSMVYIEGGAFLCGRYRDKNSRIVTVAPFMISKAETTNREYYEYVKWCMDHDPNAVSSILPNFDTNIGSLKLARFNDEYFKDYFYNVAFHNYPVINVSWIQAIMYCKWRSDRGNEKINPNFVQKCSTYAIEVPKVPGAQAQPQNPMIQQNPMMGAQMGINPMLQQNPMMGGQMGMQNPMMQQNPMMGGQMGMQNPMMQQNPMMGGQMGMQNPMMQPNPMMGGQMGMQNPMMQQNPMMGGQMGQFMSEKGVGEEKNNGVSFKRVMMPMMQQNPMMGGINPMVGQMVINPMMGGQMRMNPMMQQNPMMGGQMEQQQNQINKKDLNDDVVCFRLPTEIEWEYVASGAHGEMYNGVPVCKQGIYSWGDGIKIRGEFGEWNNKVLGNFFYQPGNYNGVPGETNKINLNTDVFAFPPNILGVFDLDGNVAEWVADVYRSLGAQEYADFNPYRKDGVMDDAKNYIETGINDDMRVYKGASWNDPLYYCQIGTRRFLHKEDSSPEIGFRVVMNVAFDANELQTAKAVVSNEKKNNKTQPKGKNNNKKPMNGNPMMGGMNPMGGQMGMNPMMQQNPMMGGQMGMQPNPMMGGMMPQQRW